MVANTKGTAWARRCGTRRCSSASKASAPKQATTGAFTDNAASLGVTRSLGYEPNGRLRHQRRGEVAETLRFRMERDHWATIRRDDISLHGVEAAAELLGL